MLPLIAALADRGFDATAEGPNTALLVVPFDYAEVGADLDAVLEVAANSVVLDLIIPVLNIHAARFEAALPDKPSASVRGLIDLDEGELHIVATEAAAAPDAALVVESLIPRTCQALRDLLDAGIVDVSDASDDDRVAELLESLPTVKQANPRDAVSLALEGADRCRSLGDSTLGSHLEIAAGEVLIELGDINAAAELIEPAWVQMDAPTHWRDVVTVMAQLRARQGRLAEAVSLMEDALDQQQEEFDAAVVRGDLGVLLAQHGRRVEASRLLDAAMNDKSLDDHHRAHFRRQLAILRSVGGAVGQDTATHEEKDALGVADARLNELGAILLEADRRTLAAKRTRLGELIEMVSVDLDLLGPSQTARLALARGCVAILDGQRAIARRHLDEAQSLADTSGDVELARWVRNQAESLLDPLSTETVKSTSTPMERLAALLNRALAELSTNIGRAQTTARDAIDVVDAERHRYVTVADRIAWTRLAARVYEIGLVTSLAIENDADVVEILERARAQGVPAQRHEEDGEASGDVASDGGEFSTHLLGLIRESLGDRPVSRPLVASVRNHEPATDGPVTRVALDDVLASVAGGPAWWWACHAFGERLYWVVRSAAGRTWTGANMLPGGLDGVADIAQSFRSVTSEEDLRLHPLLGDEARGRTALLDRLAKSILPRPLVDAVVEAVDRSEPIRVVWAAPRELARVPIGLLPIDHGTVFLDGAVVVVAPPTSLAMAHSIQPGASPPPRPVVLVLGADPDLGMLRDLATAISSDPDRVLGAARHVKSGIAGSLGTPAAVLGALRDNPRAVAVYYGHIDEDGASSHSAALSLTDGVRRATLEASRLLVADRDGAPDIVVLAGCSSLSASHSGTGEWWGFATALLWQGSHHVIGSMWDLLPTPTTQTFVAELTAALRTSADPQLVLRDLQRSYHSTWTRTGQPSPYEWAGWSIVSSSGAAAN